MVLSLSDLLYRYKLLVHFDTRKFWAIKVQRALVSEEGGRKGVASQLNYVSHAAPDH